MSDAIAFDLEITNVLEDFGQWREQRPLGISCLAMSAGEHSYIYFAGRAPLALDERTSSEIVHFMYDEYFCEQYTIVTFNGLGFDFVVLADASREFTLCREMALSDYHVDLMFNAYMALGHNIGLNTACEETFGAQKVGFESGAEAPVAWHDGRHKEVIEYCKNDALITFKLYKYLQTSPCLKWKTRRGKGKPRQLFGNSKWRPTWSVARMLEREPPEVPQWMRNKPITLKHFLEPWNG